MKALIIGSGAREHALAWKFSTSKRISGLYTLPGNAGTAELGDNITGVDINDFKSVITICKERNINLVFVGPEAPLASGFSDSIQAAGINVVSPLQEAARLESSKLFSKQFMTRHGIPTAEAREFTAYEDFETYIQSTTGMRVVKKNGLAAGKGVLESDNPETLLAFGKSVLESDSLLVEEYLQGYEISIFALFDGEHYLLFPPCADFKKAGPGDTGPNTGGMGAICPVPGIDRSLLEQIEREIVVPSFEGIKSDGLPYTGFLYFGLMITDSGPKLLEYNVRLGDPEAQVLIPLIQSDFGNLMDAVVQKSLDRFPLRIADMAAVGVVIASEGYPGAYTKGIPVTQIPENNHKKKFVFHASTLGGSDREVQTGGGRCFTAVGLHHEILEAQRIAYALAEGVRFEGAWYREDIGNKFFF